MSQKTKVARRNHEGYADPTAYEALKSIMPQSFSYRPIVYVCSPFSGDVEGNILKARRYCRFVVDQGGIPLAPHLLFPQFMNEDTERELAMFMDMALLSKAAQLWVFGDRISEGMQREIERADSKRMPIRFINEEEMTCTK